MIQVEVTVKYLLIMITFDHWPTGSVGCAIQLVFRRWRVGSLVQPHIFRRDVKYSHFQCNLFAEPIDE